MQNELKKIEENFKKLSDQNFRIKEEMLKLEGEHRALKRMIDIKSKEEAKKE